MQLQRCRSLRSAAVCAVFAGLLVLSFQVQTNGEVQHEPQQLLQDEDHHQQQQQQQQQPNQRRREISSGNVITFRGYGCGQELPGHSTCSNDSALCNKRHPTIIPEELLTDVENRPYHIGNSSSSSSSSSSFDKWCRLPVARMATGCTASSVEFRPPGTSPAAATTATATAATAGPFSSPASLLSLLPAALTSSPEVSDEEDAVPVLGFVVAKGGRMVERGLLSVDYPVRRLVVVQMGNDPDVTSAIARVKKKPGFEKLRVVDNLGNLGCAAGWNRVVLEDLNADYWMILGYDISFPPGVLRLIHKQSTRLFKKHTRLGIIHFWYQWGGFKSEWSAFILRKEVIHDIGFFDENVWPVNTEDYDYSVRMSGNYRREPWYRHLLPPKTATGSGCPSFYLEHGVANLGNSGTAHIVQEAKKTSSGACRADAVTYQDWQRRRGTVAYVSNKWGRRPGRSGGELLQPQRCRDGDPRYGVQPEEGRDRKFYKHPTGADYYPPVVTTTTFRDPYGHQHLPVWFWVLDPGTRRCLITGQLNNETRGGAASKALSQPRGEANWQGEPPWQEQPSTASSQEQKQEQKQEQELEPELEPHQQSQSPPQPPQQQHDHGEGDVGGAQPVSSSAGNAIAPSDNGSTPPSQGRRRLVIMKPLPLLDTEPCIAMRPAVPFTFDQLSGLPERCVDALDLCTSSLTSLQKTSFLVSQGLSPPLPANREVCSRGPALPAPLPVKPISGPCPAKAFNPNTGGRRGHGGGGRPPRQTNRGKGRAAGHQHS